MLTNRLSRPSQIPRVGAYWKSCVAGRKRSDGSPHACPEPSRHFPTPCRAQEGRPRRGPCREHRRTRRAHRRRGSRRRWHQWVPNPYDALLVPSRWWSSDHTFSGNAANLTLEPRAGGCWCEKLSEGGSVEHLRVVYVAPGKLLRMRGALGPFQGLAVDGVFGEQAERFKKVMEGVAR